MQLAVGDVVKVPHNGYDSGPYKIIKVSEPCTCPSYVDSINMRNPPAREEHYHFTCEAAHEAPAHYHRGRGNYYLDSFDNLVLLRAEPAQMDLFQEAGTHG